MGLSQFPPAQGGIPTGTTAERPASPAIGDVFYNGTTTQLEIWDGSSWQPCSAPPDIPVLATPTDASTSDAYTSTAGKLSVAFTPGAFGGKPGTYTAYTTAGGFTASSSSTTVTITGLTPGTSYQVYGTVSNGFGTSGNSLTSSAVVPSTLPQAPTIGTATTSGGTTNVTVTWTLGSNGGKNLTAITITPYLNGTTAQTSQTAATTSSTSHTFTGLTEGSSYTFKVKTTNANGDSPESSATNSVTIPVTILVDYLVVAGGGGGSWSGAGAGGLRSTMNNTGGGGSLESTIGVQPNTNYTVTVGAGGAGAYTTGGDGSNSVFSTVTSTGGGGGVTGGVNGRTGGSGSGAGRDNQNRSGGAGTANQGYGGGNNVSVSPYGVGGGGGAGQAGANASGSNSGAGGNGVAVSITGSSVTYAGGGGGGGSNENANPGAGGTGGGGAGVKGNGVAGTANTGGGGGGQWAEQSSYSGGNGGSGVVILRWLTSKGSITVGAGLTADATGTDGLYSYKRFTAGTGNVSWS